MKGSKSRVYMMREEEKINSKLMVERINECTDRREREEKEERKEMKSAMRKRGTEELIGGGKKGRKKES